MIEQYGIGYTIFKFDGNKKISMEMIKAKPGNLSTAYKSIEKRVHKLSHNKGLMSAMTWTMIYGFTFRTMIAVI